MANEEKVQVVRFSLPYREGMESEPGYKEKVESTSKTFPEEKVFGKFEFDLDNTIQVDEADALATGLRVLRQNKQRANLIGSYANKYGIVAPGVSGGLSKTDKAIIKAMGTLTNDPKKIAAAFKVKSGKDVTADEIKDILAA